MLLSHCACLPKLRLDAIFLAMGTMIAHQTAAPATIVIIFRIEHGAMIAVPETESCSYISQM